MRTYKIYLIRHATTQGNLEGRYIGATDLPICSEGIEQINNLVEKYDYPSVGRVYVSPLCRCAQTAELIYPDHKPVVIDDIREYNFGEFENRLITELIEEDKYNKWIETKLDGGLEGAEDMASFHERVINGLDSIIMDMMKNKVSDAAVVTHGGVMMQMLSSCGLPKRKPTEWVVGNGKGYTLLVNASLWGNNKVAEVFTAIPYEKIENATNDEDIDDE